MAYTKQTWTDGSGGGTPLSAARMTVIENGIKAADDAASAAVKTVNGTTPDGSGNVVVAASASTPTTVAYAATITPNSDTTKLLNIGALTGPLTLANPTGAPVDGQNLRVRFSQDASGSRVVTFGSGYAFGIDVTTVLIPTLASTSWEMLFTWHAASSKWRAVSLIRGF